MCYNSLKVFVNLVLLADARSVVKLVSILRGGDPRRREARVAVHGCGRHKGKTSQNQAKSNLFLEHFLNFDTKLLLKYSKHSESCSGMIVHLELCSL